VDSSSSVGEGTDVRREASIQWVAPSLGADAKADLPLAPITIILVDATQDLTAARATTAAVRAAVGPVPSRADSVVLMSFSNRVVLHDISVPPTCTVAEAFAGGSLPSQAHLDRRSRIIAAAASCPPSPAAMTGIQHALGAIEAAAPNPTDRWSSEAAGTLAPAARQRALGTALALAMQVARAAPGSGQLGRPLSRIICFTSGPATYGPGACATAADEEAARRFYAALGREAAEQQVRLDIVCGGAASFRAPVLREATAPSGGKLLVYAHFHQDVGPVARGLLAPDFGANADLGAVASPGIRAVRMIGPATEHRAEEPEGEESVSLVLPSSLLRCRVTTVRRGVAFAVFLELDEAAATSARARSDELVLQLVLRYTRASDGVLVHQIHTHRLRWASSVAEYAASVDPQVMTCLLAKQLALEARNSGASAAVATAAADARARAILAACAAIGRPRPAQGPAPPVSSLEPRDVFLPTLDRLPLLLYGYLRSTLAGDALQHEDDIDVMRSTFLDAPLDEALRLAVPAVYAVTSVTRGGHGAGVDGLDETDETDDEDSFDLLDTLVDGPESKVRTLDSAPGLRRLPAVSLALQSDAVLLIDCGTEIFVWSGADTDGSSGDARRGRAALLAADAAATRHPLASVTCVSERDSMARLVVARLEPLHHDGPAVQLARFPSLASLASEDERRALSAKFVKSDILSFHQWWLGIVGNLVGKQVETR
jgi:hypothetical protein